MLVAGICWVALLMAWWWAGRKPHRLSENDLHRLQRMAENIHREQVQPFD